jgi:hypothetical protein
MQRHCTMTAPAISLQERLEAIHDHYVEAVNLAVAADDTRRIADLESDFNDEALAAIVDHERTARPPRRE